MVCQMKVKAVFLPEIIRFQKKSIAFVLLQYVNRWSLMMKKNMWLVAGIAGLLSFSSADAQAELSIRLGDIRIDAGDRPSFVIETRPNFIYLEDQGFSVAIDSPYDIISYDDLYYLYRDGSWYRSDDYRGPWSVMPEYDLPSRIRRQGWDDIRRYRDIEYRRHDRSYWEETQRRDMLRERDQRNQRDQRREDGNRSFDGSNRGNDNRKMPDQPRRDGPIMKAPDQPRRDGGNIFKGPEQPRKEAPVRKAPDQPRKEGGNIFKGPEQPRKETPVRKAPEQPRKDDNRKAPGQPDKGDKENNPNQPR